jgi:hypothetical protein
MDGFGWFNNSGEFEVTVNPEGAVPEPGTYGMIAGGLLALSLLRTRRVRR